MFETTFGEFAETGIQQRCIFPLKNAQTANFMAHGDISVRDASSDSCSYLGSLGIVGGRKRRRDRNGFDATVDDIGNCFIQCRFINRSDLQPSNIYPPPIM